METALEQLIKENKKIIERRADLLTRGTFDEDGEKYFQNLMKIKRVRSLPVVLEAGKCSCNNRITRDQYEIKFCAWCHKEITDSIKTK